MYLIYKITNHVNNKLYVGKTVQSLADRWTDHLLEANRWKNCKQANQDFGYNSKLYPAMAKYGFENFSIELLEVVNTIEELNAREKFWIDCLQTRKDGYNIAAGGDGGFFFGCKHSEEAKAKIRKASSGRFHTQAAKQKMSKAKQGHFTSEETKEKIRKTKTGVKYGPQSKAWRENISKGHVHEIICIETGISYRNIMEAARQTAIHRSAISNCLTGHSKTAGGYHWKYKN